MVNYLYKLDDIEKNHEALAQHGQIAASAEVRRLAATGPAETGGGAGRRRQDEKQSA